MGTRTVMWCFMTACRTLAEVSPSPGYDGNVVGDFPSPYAGTPLSCAGWAGSPCNCQCAIEHDEWMPVDALVRPDDVVIEWGARHGTTSCRLARATNNTGNVISVEPDARVYANILQNRQAHHCNFHLVRGTVSDVPLKMAPLLSPNGAFGQRTDTTHRPHQSVPNHDFRDLQHMLGRKITVALIDCEGCIQHCLFLPDLMAQLELIIIEEDMYTRNQTRAQDARVDYDAWYLRLHKAGFTQVWRSHDTASFRRLGHAWGNPLLHSAWVKRSKRRGVPADACKHHSHATKLPRELLNCAPIARPVDHLISSI
jgi:FkbM family methyltransferase